MEAHVLEQHDRVARRLLEQALDLRARALVELRHRPAEPGLAEQLGEPGGDRVEPQLLHHLALGPTQVAHEHRAPAAARDLEHGRKRGADARVVGDFAASVGRLGNVEVDAHEHAPALELDRVEAGEPGQLLRGHQPLEWASFISSTTRFE